jgi:hypothetical protein
MINVQGDQAPSKQQKMLKKFENSSTKSVTEQSMSSQTALGLVMEFANMQTCAALLLYHDNVPTHTSLKITESVSDNNLHIFLHPPYSPDLALCDFALFPKLKMKLKGHFERVSDIQRELQAVLDSINKKRLPQCF